MNSADRAALRAAGDSLGALKTSGDGAAAAAPANAASARAAARAARRARAVEAAAAAPAEDDAAVVAAPAGASTPVAEPASTVNAAPAAAPAAGDAGSIFSSLSDAAAPAADGAGPFSALFSAFSEAFTEGLQPSPLKGRANEQPGDSPGLLSPGAQLRADAQRRMVRRASFNGSSSSASTSPDPAVAAAAAARRDRDLAEEKAIRERAARKEGEQAALLHAGAPRSDELTVAKLASSKLSDGVLRGIPLPTLMRGAGRIFAENGEAARRDPRGTYALSVPTESLDFFVSHSWRCPRIFTLPHSGGR